MYVCSSVEGTRELSVNVRGSPYSWSSSLTWLLLITLGLLPHNSPGQGPMGGGPFYLSQGEALLHKREVCTIWKYFQHAQKFATRTLC